MTPKPKPRKPMNKQIRLGRWSCTPERVIPPVRCPEMRPKEARQLADWLTRYAEWAERKNR